MNEELLYGLSPEQVFRIASQMVLPGWILLIALPRWIGTRWIVHNGILPSLLAAAYLAIIIPVVNHGGMNLSDFGSLAGVEKLFTQHWVVVAGWIHYCVFDLWTGAWIVRDAGRIGIMHALVIPCLALTFVFGPVGLLAYFILRWVVIRQVSVE
ncbi:DUF4281 domain-containing protein [bacterium]|nr:DUF4281 domain-containing protein [bacterium]